MVNKNILEILKSLSPSELQDVHVNLYNMLSSVQLTTFNDEAHLTNGIVCHKCGSIHCVKNGNVNGKQRFLCRDCGVTFGVSTNSAISHSKLSKEKWISYIKCMTSGLTLRKSADIVGVCLKTSFYMRHKILEAISSYMDRGNVSGIAELDETYLPQNFKGNHKKSKFQMPRKSRKRGKQVTRRGISRDQICIGTAIDQSGSVIMTTASQGRITYKGLLRLYTGHLAEGSTICTDSFDGYRVLSEHLNLSHKRIPSGKHSDGIFNLAHINSLHSRFKGWMYGFRGVATKHLESYLVWFRWLEANKNLRETAKPEQMWVDAMAKQVDVRIDMIRQHEVMFV